MACAGRIELGLLSEMMRLPVRTLQRRLTEAGVSCLALVQEIQFARTLQLMEDPSRRLVDIAVELGFSDAAHFTRAFRRWTGVSPLDVRRLHRSDGRTPSGRASDGTH